MPGKRKKSSPGMFPRKAVPVTQGETEEETALNYAKMTASPELAAYRVINGVEAKSGIGDQLDVPALLAVLRNQAEIVSGGDLVQVEAMLINQATALQSLFARLAERGMGCEERTPFEANMKMALRAQSQCRATLETLAAIKTPPVVYANQANVTSGPQQVNNCAASRARGNETGQNKLSGAENELLPHTEAPSLPGEDDSPVEAVGKIDRTKVP